SSSPESGGSLSKPRSGRHASSSPRRAATEAVRASRSRASARSTMAWRSSSPTSKTASGGGRTGRGLPRTAGAVAPPPGGRAGRGKREVKAARHGPRVASLRAALAALPLGGVVRDVLRQPRERDERAVRRTSSVRRLDAVGREAAVYPPAPVNLLDRARDADG